MSSRIRFLWAGVAFLLLLVLMVAVNWPFTKQKTIRLLESRSGRKVRISSFQPTYFPPGFETGEIDFLRTDHPDKEPLIRVKRLVLRSSWSRLLTLTKMVAQVDVYDLRLSIPPRGVSADGKHHTLIPTSSHNTKSGSGEGFDRMVLHSVLVEFLKGESETEPLRVPIRELTLMRVKDNEPFRFEAVVANPLPSGDVYEKGTFGPWLAEDPSRTPVQGTFTFPDGHLQDIRGISGTLHSEGRFGGTLDRIEVVGTALVPDFRVLQSSHRESLKSSYEAAVNATAGDVELHRVDTTLGRTTIHAEGRVAGFPGVKGKVATLQAKVVGGRVEDLEKMLMASKTVPLLGSISLDTSIRLMPGPQRFLARLEMAGTFKTMGEKFTNPKTQGALNALAREPVDSQMSARVVVKGGVARIIGLLLTCPETAARVDGKFDLLSRQVDLRGTLKTDGKLSDTQSGFKAFAVKMITPFLKRQGSTVVPFRIQGSFGDLQTRVDLWGKRKL